MEPGDDQRNVATTAGGQASPSPTDPAVVGPAPGGRPVPGGGPDPSGPSGGPSTGTEATAGPPTASAGNEPGAGAGLDQPDVTSDEPEERQEIERLRAERDAAVKALDRQGRRARLRARARRILVGVLVVLFAILLPVTAVVGWTHNLVLNTNGWTRTVGPLASNPAVTAAVSRDVTNQAFTALDAQAQIADALPPKASFLAAPITNGVKGYVQTAVNDALSSKQFQTIWVNANRFAHQQLVNVLNGHSKALTTTDGQVVLNLVPLLNAALQQIEPFISGVVGKPVSLPAISSNDIPSVACEKISAALDRPVPSTCGQIPLFPADKLNQAQRLVRVFNRVTVLLIVVTPVLAGLALWISRRRRRTLLQLTVGGLLGLVVARRALWWLEGSLIRAGKPENKAARQAIVQQVTHGFFTLTTWLIVGLVVIFALTLLTGPYAWARQLRAYVVQAGRWLWDAGAATVGKARDEATTAWIRDHAGALRIGGVVLAVILMLIFSVSFIGFLVIAALLAGYELWLRRVGGSGPATPLPAGGPGADAKATGSPTPESRRDVDLRQ